MAETSDGHVSSASDSGETPREVPVCAGAGEARVPPPTAGGLSPTIAGMTAHQAVAGMAG
jgi:hypothetical protein